MYLTDKYTSGNVYFWEVGNMSITAGALYKVFGQGYHDGAMGLPMTLPEDSMASTAYVQQLQLVYKGGYERGRAARIAGTYRPKTSEWDDASGHAEAWRDFLSKYPLP